MTAPDPSAHLHALLADEGIESGYPDAVHAEVAAWIENPQIDASDLDDRTDVPFVTVDGPGTRDLDQALFVERRGSGYGVQYAIADASFFAPAHSALFEESLRRGASYYLPGSAVPMLPRALSEDLVSLGEGVDRRAMVFDMTLDAQGVCTKTDIVRSRIRSRHQLTFAHVDAVVRGKGRGRGEHPVTDPAIEQSLHAMRAVGALRAADAAARGVVPYHRKEVRVKLGQGQDAGLTAVEVVRNGVEADNAQLSLLCNAQGAEVLRSMPGDHGQPIYKVHPSPDEDALASLQETIDAVVHAYDLDDTWRWDRRTQPLADYVRSLPDQPEHARLVLALMRQTIMVNVRSSFAKAPGRHHGVGADVYGRFSAPMREVVGVFLHKEMFEALAQRGQPPKQDELLRQHVIEAANKAKQLQSMVSRAADKLVIDDLFAADLATAAKARRTHGGTVMGMRKGRIYVRLDSPPLDVKIYADRLDERLEEDAAGASIHSAGRRVARLGDPVGVQVRHRTDDGRWVLGFAD
ncbi:MAG: RNB domain-containing ribonuclease [Myxococcota bacterium]